MIQTFFIAQGKTYELQKNGGFIWSPSKLTTGLPRFYFENIIHFEIGDIVLHYSKEHFRAISKVEPIVPDKAYIPLPMPAGFSREKWYNEGYIAKCNYIEFEKPLPITYFHEVIMKYRASKYSAFDRDGKVCQGYLYRLEKEIADAVIKEAVEIQPELFKLNFISNYLQGD